MIVDKTVKKAVRPLGSSESFGTEYWFGLFEYAALMFSAAVFVE